MVHVPTWRRLPYSGAGICAPATPQLWTQIVGKVRLALTPWLNDLMARDVAGDVARIGNAAHQPHNHHFQMVFDSSITCLRCAARTALHVR